LNKALLDTDTYSEILKAANPIVVRHATNYRRTHGVLTFSTITVMEVTRGFQRAHLPHRLQAFMTAIALEEVLPFDHAAAELAGRIAGDLERIGQPIGVADPMIAAIAISNGLELVTGNTTHFERIRRLGYSLTLINWRT